MVPCATVVGAPTAEAPPPTFPIDAKERADDRVIGASNVFPVLFRTRPAKPLDTPTRLCETAMPAAPEAVPVSRPFNTRFPCFVVACPPEVIVTVDAKVPKSRVTSLPSVTVRTAELADLGTTIEVPVNAIVLADPVELLLIDIEF